MEVIKTTTKKYKISQVSDKSMKYTEYFVGVRKYAREKCDKCFICEDSFNLGDDLYILFMENTTNKVACTECANKVRATLKGE